MFNITYPTPLCLKLLNDYGRCITIFSAPNYCDSTGNKGAIIKFGHDLKPRFEQVVVEL